MFVCSLFNPPPAIWKHRSILLILCVAQSTYSSRRLTDHLRCNFKQVIQVWFLSGPLAPLAPGCGLI